MTHAKGFIVPEVTAIDLSATARRRRRFAYIKPPEGDPISDMIARGRWSPDIWATHMTAAEQFLAPKRKPGKVRL